jgi:SAM-dependent methyltransferase
VYPTASVVTCDACAATYPVVDGVPVMLTATSRRALDRGKMVDPIPDTSHRGRSKWIQRLARVTACAAPIYDPGQEKRIRALVRELGEKANILDLGSGGRNRGATVIGMDVERLPHVGVVGDGEQLPFADGVLDGILCTGVLEHVSDAEAIAREIWRVLRPGGMVYVAVPFIQGYHPATGTHQDFRRFTHIGLQQLLSAFEQVDSGVSGGPSSSLAWILREYLAMLFVGGGWLYKVAYRVSAWLTFWIIYLDRVVAHRETAHRIACGFYFLGRKPTLTPRGDS